MFLAPDNVLRNVFIL